MSEQEQDGALPDDWPFDGEEMPDLATGGIIDHPGLVIFGQPGVEAVYIPKQAPDMPKSEHPAPPNFNVTWTNNTAATIPWGQYTPSWLSTPRPATWTPVTDPLTEERVQELIQESLARVFRPHGTGAVDGRRWASVSLETSEGDLWRGVVYPVDTEE